MSLTLRQAMSVSAPSVDSAKEALSLRVQEISDASKDFSYTKPESFSSFIFDEKVLEDIKELVAKKTQNGLPKVVFVVGIGGANLAAKAVYDGILGHGEAVYDLPRKMVFLDTLDDGVTEPTLLLIKTLTDINDFVVVIVSKSGRTLEVMANAEFLTYHLEQKFQGVSERMVIVSQEGSPLWDESLVKNIDRIALPESLSDRFSAFSPTALVPLALYGFLVDEFLAGAHDSFLEMLSVGSIPFQNAIAIDEHYANGMNIYDLFFFTPRLETLGKWQKQLIAESLGKEESLNGEDLENGARLGLSPVVSIGSTDLHSSLQLVLAGPKNRITSFVSVEGGDGEEMGDGETLDVIEKSVSQKTAGELNQVLLSSAQESYFKNHLPFADITLSDVTLRTLGEYMVYAMLEVLFIGALWNVNVFNQPNVEEYKKRASDILKD